jgi:hypothetical protein
MKKVAHTSNFLVASARLALKESASKSAVLLEMPLLQLTLWIQMASAAEAALYQLISWYTFCLW